MENLLLFLGAAWVSFQVLKWTLNTLGKVFEKIFSFVLPAITLFVVYSMIQSGSTEASALVVPAGVVVGAVIENSMGV